MSKLISFLKSLSLDHLVDILVCLVLVVGCFVGLVIAVSLPVKELRL